MAQRPVRQRKSSVDPMFFIPDGVDELEYREEEIFVESSEEDTIISADVYEEPEFESDTDDSDLPGVPDIYGIFSQTLRRNSSGSQVVDVVLDVEDMANQYDVRITKNDN
jgi:hypothetical protein